MKRDMTVKEKLMYMLTGKFPEEREEDVLQEEVVKEEEEVEKNEETVEEKFLAATSMTKKQAISKVKAWKLAGEEEKVKKGLEMLKKFFPGEKFLEKTEEKTENSENIFSDGEKSEKPAKKAVKIAKSTVKNPLGSLGVSQKNPDTENLPDENSIDDSERTFAALSYVPFMCFFVVFARKDSKFVQFHAWQAITIIALFLASSPLNFILGFIPGIGFLFWLFTVALFAGSIFACFSAFNGRYASLPVVSQIGKTLSGREQ